MKEFASVDDIPTPHVLIGLEAVYKYSGYSKHHIMRARYMGTFPPPIGRVKITYKAKRWEMEKIDKHWSFVWDRNSVMEWVENHLKTNEL